MKIKRYDIIYIEKTIYWRQKYKKYLVNPLVMVLGYDVRKNHQL